MCWFQKKAARAVLNTLPDLRLSPPGPFVFVRHQPILSQARALTRGRPAHVGSLRAQARIRPAAVVGLVPVRGIAREELPCIRQQTLPPVASAVPTASLQLGSRFGVWGLRLERLP